MLNYFHDRNHKKVSTKITDQEERMSYLNPSKFGQLKSKE